MPSSKKKSARRESPNKKSQRRKSPIKGVSLKEIDTVKKSLPPKKVLNSFFKDIISSNKKHSDDKKMELPEFCNYLNKHVSKRELREICQIINIPFYEDEKASDTCIRIENSAGYIMSPKKMNILKVFANYSAYIGGLFVYLIFAGNIIDNLGKENPVVWVLDFLAHFSIVTGILSLGSDTLGALGLNKGGIISGFEPIKSKIRHQVFKVLGKDTRESEGGNRKRTIKKIR